MRRREREAEAGMSVHKWKPAHSWQENDGVPGVTKGWCLVIGCSGHPDDLHGSLPFVTAGCLLLLLKKVTCFVSMRGEQIMFYRLDLGTRTPTTFSAGSWSPWDCYILRRFVCI